MKPIEEEPRVSNFQDVQRFHDVLGYEHREQGPHLLPPSHQAHRFAFLREEVDELEEACYQGDLATALDSLVDLVYVALGTADMMGLPWQAAWERVHAANMQKKPGVKAGRSGGPDAVKPEGWQPPVMDDLVLPRKKEGS